MKVVRRYLLGLAAAAVVGVGVVLLLPGRLQGAIALAIVMGFLIQAPLGLVLVRAFGTERFLAVWGLGMGSRLLAVGLFAFLGMRMGIPALEPLLIGLVSTLFCLVLVEAGALLKGEAE